VGACGLLWITLARNRSVAALTAVDSTGSPTRKDSPAAGRGQGMALPDPDTAGRALCGWLPAGAYQKIFFVREIVARRCVNQIAAGPSPQVFCLIRLVSSAIWL
jgi:hypothetical protein